MKQRFKKHQIIIGISIILMLCTGIVGYLWYQHYCDKQIAQAKQDIQYSNRVLSKFRKQKTLYQKVDFLLHTLPDSNKKSPFCIYGYDKDFQDNGWRDANPTTIEVSSTIGQHKTNDYEVLYLKPLSSKENSQYNICSLRIRDKSDNHKDYWLDIDNDWNIVDSGISNSDRSISKKQKEELLDISKKNINLLFKAVENNMKQYKKDAEKVLKHYHVSN